MGSVPAGLLLGLVIGAAFGLAPLLVGVVEARRGLGIIGFVACALVGAGWSAVAGLSAGGLATGLLAALLSGILGWLGGAWPPAQPPARHRAGGEQDGEART